MVAPSVRVFRLAVRWLTRQEAIVLLIAFGIILALLVFAKTAGEMLEGDMREFDEGVLRYLRDPDDPSKPIGPPWLVAVALDATALGGMTVLVIVLVVVTGYLALDRRYGELVLIVVAAAVGGALSQGLKLFFARARPDIVPHLVTVASASFPSGHSMLAVVTYLTLIDITDFRAAIREMARVLKPGGTLLVAT